MKKFIVNDKYLDAMAVALSDQTYLLDFEGTIRSQKTVTAIQAFYELIQDSDEELHLISSENLDAIRDNILISDFGLEKCYPKKVTREREEFGGYYLQIKCDVPGKPKIKRVILCGFGDSGQWKKINGKTLGVILIDEVNNANEQFVDECFARQASVKHPKMLWTLNGDIPSHPIYQKYINYCKIIGKCPASTRADMDKFVKKQGYYYMHWTMKDNPAMSPEQIERTSSIYPIGSYYYTIKILGERGAPGDLIYNDYMKPDKLIKKLDDQKFNKYVIGVDIGASKAQNSFSLIGYSNDYSRCGVVDKTTFQQCGYAQKTQLLKAFVLKHQQAGKYIECISVDSAEQNYIRDLQTAFKTQVIPSYKATIKERIDMGIVLLASGRMLFNDTQEGKDAYDAFLIARWAEGKKGQEREDKNERHNDIIDSVEYGLTVHMKALMFAKSEVARE